MVLLFGSSAAQGPIWYVPGGSVKAAPAVATQIPSGLIKILSPISFVKVGVPPPDELQIP